MVDVAARTAVLYTLIMWDAAVLGSVHNAVKLCAFTPFVIVAIAGASIKSAKRVARDLPLHHFGPPCAVRIQCVLTSAICPKCVHFVVPVLGQTRGVSAAVLRVKFNCRRFLNPLLHYRPPFWPRTSASTSGRTTCRFAWRPWGTRKRDCRTVCSFWGARRFIASAA